MELGCASPDYDYKVLASKALRTSTGVDITTNDLDELQSLAEKQKHLIKEIRSASESGSVNRQVLICIEEAAEFSIEVIRSIRGVDNKLDLLEELADMTLSVDCMRQSAGITDDELNRAVAVKCSRIARVLSENGCYS